MANGCRKCSSKEKEVAKFGMSAMTKQVAAQSKVIAGKQVAKTGMSAVTKQAVTQTASSTGQEMAKTGIHVATKEVGTQSVSNAGRELVKTGVRVSTKEVVTGTVSKTGQEVVKTGTRTTTKEDVTKTSAKVGRESIAGGLACAVAFDSLFAAYDINCAYEDEKSGGICRRYRGILYWKGYRIQTANGFSRRREDDQNIKQNNKRYLLILFCRDLFPSILGNTG